MDDSQSPRRRPHASESLSFSCLSTVSLVLRFQNWEPASFDVKVENIRGREKSGDFTLDASGFESHTIPNTGVSFDDEESIRTAYYEDCIRNIKNITGASRVVIFDHSECAPRKNPIHFLMIYCITSLEETATCRYARNARNPLACQAGSCRPGKYRSTGLPRAYSLTNYFRRLNQTPAAFTYIFPRLMSLLCYRSASSSSTSGGRSRIQHGSSLSRSVISRVWQLKRAEIWSHRHSSILTVTERLLP
jgi:hypothetical protein